MVLTANGTAVVTVRWYYLQCRILYIQGTGMAAICNYCCANGKVVFILTAV
jgi:hypothetical protein